MALLWMHKSWLVALRTRADASRCLKGYIQLGPSAAAKSFIAGPAPASSAGVAG